MKNLFNIILLLSFLLTTVLNAQYLINNFDGIPLISIAPWDIQANQYDKMKEMGADFIIATELTEARLNEIINRGLKVIPLQADPGLYNYILKYSEGAYTKWEAEGTPLGKGDAKLQYNQNIGTTFNSGGRQGVVTQEGAGYDTLITGPGYMQERRYWRIDTGYVNYTVAFNMLLTNTIPPESGNPNDTICILQVTDSNIECCYWPNQLFDTSRVLLRSDFTPGVWQTFNLTYNFQSEESDGQQPANQLPNYTYQNYQNNDPSNKNLADFVQFKIVWKGDQYSRLYVDNITVFDQKGKDIVTNPNTQSLINIQATQSFLNTYLDTTVAAWFTIDEPETIDNYEPIRKIDSLLKANSNGKRGIWVSFPSSWNGRYGDSYLGTHGLYKSNEFVQRTGISPHQNNHPLYDYPFTQENINNYHSGDDYRDWNIKYLADTIMNKINDWDPNFSMTLLCGRYDDAALLHDPLPHEMLYEANLKLMYGAKSLSLYKYYGDGLNPSATGLVTYDANGYYYTPKWYMVKNILSHRLKDKFGKTLKSVHQTVQYLNHQLSSPEGFIKTIIKGSCTVQGMQPSTEAYDLGFFRDAQYGDYFMIINRWYSPACNPSLTVRLKPGYFSNYNLRVVDYINNQTFNTNRFGSISTAPVVGDACFFGVFPVLTYGGSITANDTTNDYQTLLANMTIENGATLYVYETYNAEGNITVKAGGKIKNYENGKIIFSPGKKLIIEGSAEINGTSNDRLSLEFNSSTTEGVIIKQGASLSLTYCDIKYAQIGIKAEVGTEGIYIANTNFTNCSNTGISLLGDSNHNEATPTIYKCTITGSSTGISAVNYSEVLLQENTISNSNFGITVSSIPSAFIQGNLIYDGSDSPVAGIFMENCGGYIRCNYVTDFNNGIHIGNSSPDIGSNTLEHNEYHGLYIGGRSIPNMIGRIISGPPYTWYGASGFNHIIENGMGNNFGDPSVNDGSEIYFSRASALLGTEKRPGCNVIADDRESTPTMSTLYLMSGSLADDLRELYAQKNCWGTTEPTQDRFERLPVIFSPYNLEPCPLPDERGSGSEELVLKTSTGIVVDTLYPSAFVPDDITALEASYSEADKHFIALEMEQAKTIYEQIVQGNYTSEEKLPAYNRLYTIANLTSADENYFSSLQTTFNNIASTEPDTLLMKIYEQNAIKCDVSKEEYLTAISKFDNIIQQNPESEEAVYAEIDILTTALNLDTTNSGLGKIAGGKYLVKGTSDYLTRLNDLLQDKFGINTEDQEQIIPKEYSLYQNYPNPFNPVTTIKFDLPKDGLVSIEIFDILGRRIITLVNENRIAGSYEQSFNASLLASGVYVYKLQSGDFISSKKMILLK